MRYILTVLAVFLTTFGVEGGEGPVCLNDLEIDFFKEEQLNEAFSIHEVPEGNWHPIYEALVSRSQDVPFMVQEKAQPMNPNPLNPPYDAQAIEPLLKDALFQVFQDVLNQYDVSDQGEITDMFNYIYEQNTSTVRACLSEDY